MYRLVLLLPPIVLDLVAVCWCYSQGCAHAGDTGMAVVNVAPMDVAVIPIFEPLDLGREGIDM